MLPVISVVIPAKNESARIGGCIESLLAMELSKHSLEVIVVDNGSSDDTVAIAAGYGAKILHQPGSTIAEMRNLGAGAAEGEIVGFVDADCLVDRQWFVSALPHFQDPNVGCVGATAVAPPDGSWVQTAWGAFRTRKNGSGEAGWINSMNMFVRRELFFEIGGFATNLATCEDVDFCYRLSRSCRLVVDERVRVVHLGEAHDVRTFFFKELWRGQSNWAGVLMHGVVAAELPSLLLPVYYLAATAALIASAVNYLSQGSASALGVACLLLLFPPLLFSVSQSLLLRRLRLLMPLFALFLTYSAARSLSLVYRVSR